MQSYIGPTIRQSSSRSANYTEYLKDRTTVGSLTVSEDYGPHPPLEQFLGSVFIFALPKPLGWPLDDGLGACGRLFAEEFATYLPFGTAAFGSMSVLANNATASATPQMKSVIRDSRNQLRVSDTVPSEFIYGITYETTTTEAFVYLTTTVTYELDEASGNFCHDGAVRGSEQ